MSGYGLITDHQIYITIFVAFGCQLARDIKEPLNKAQYFFVLSFWLYRNLKAAVSGRSSGVTWRKSVYRLMSVAFMIQDVSSG